MAKHIVKPLTKWRKRLHEIIFEADTKPGRIFDILLIISILISVVLVLLDSVASIEAKYGFFIHLFEWIFTILFSIEYILRLISVGRPLSYARSFFGIIDLLAILPTYLSILFPGSQYFMIIRLLRVVRIFRILKLVQFLKEAQLLAHALRASGRKIIVFLSAVVIIAFLSGALMYAIEGEANGFASIPHGIYWAIVTLTTVGYGDISPSTPLGQMIATIIMILGYGIIAVPTGLVSAELVRNPMVSLSTQACPQCAAEGHDADAKFCKYCGADL